jgi:hypothetical protein
MGTKEAAVKIGRIQELQQGILLSWGEGKGEAHKPPDVGGFGSRSELQ